MGNQNDALRKADEALKKMVEEKNRQKMEQDKAAIMESVGRELPGMVAPLLHQVAAASRLNTDEVISAIHGITINPPPVTVTTPEAKVTVSHEMPPMPEIPPINTSGIESAIEKGIAKAKFPAPQVTVNPAKLPDFPAFPVIPDFPSEVSIRGVDKKSPFPVMMMDVNGKPLQFPVSGGSGGGRADFFTIKDIQTSAGYSIIDQDTGAMKVSGSFSVSSSNSSTQSIDSSGNPYSAANPLPVTFTGSSSTSMSLVNSDGTYYNSDNPLPITGSLSTTPGATFFASDAVGSTNLIQIGGVSVATGLNETNAGVLRTIVMTDSVVSVNIVSGSSSGTVGQGDAATATRVVIAGNSDASVVVNSGTLTTVTTVGSITNSIAAALIDSGGVQYSTSNPIPVTITSGGSATSASNIVDSSGVAYSGSNPVPITGAVSQSGTWNVATVTTVTGITNSLQSALIDSSGVQYSGSNPIPITGTVAATKSGTWAIDNPVGQGDSATALRVILSGNSDASVVINSGTITTVSAVTGITNSIAVVQLDRDGNPQTQQTIAQGDAATAQRVVIAGNSDASVVVNSGTITTVTTLTGITNSVASAIIDSSGVQYSTSNPFPVVITSGGSATSASNIVDSSGVAYSGSNPVPITGTVTVGSVTNSIRATLLDSSGATWQPFTFDNGDSATAQRVVLAGNSAASVVVNSGTITTVTTLTGITNSVASALIDSSGVQYSTSNPVPIAWVSGAGVSTAVTIQDSSGVGYSGSNPVPVTLANAGTTINQNMIGGGNDSIFTYMARTTNPTAVADGADVRPKADKLGRAVSRPMQVRDLISTARLNVVNGTETTLLAAGGAGVFLDCISIMASNNSTNAVKVDVRSVTAGNIEFTLNVPASSSNGIVHAVPWPQGNANNNWTVDLSDDTHDITFNALFTKEV